MTGWRKRQVAAQPEQDMPKIGCVNHDCAQCKAQPVQKRPQNCGTGYCSCVECVMEPKQPKVRTGNCLRVGVCASEGHKIAPQRKPLTDEQIEALYNAAPAKRDSWKAFARAIEASHNIKENT